MIFLPDGNLLHVPLIWLHLVFSQRRLHDLHAHLWRPQPFLRVQRTHLDGQQASRSPDALG